MSGHMKGVQDDGGAIMVAVDDRNGWSNYVVGLRERRGG